MKSEKLKVKKGPARLFDFQLVTFNFLVYGLNLISTDKEKIFDVVVD